MIRSDKINDILNFKCLEEHEKNIVSPKLGLDFHYVIIEGGFNYLSNIKSQLDNFVIKCQGLEDKVKLKF